METDINIPKTKAVNIFVSFAKMQIYMAIISYVLPNLIKDSVCSFDGIKLISLNFKGSIIFAILNSISLLFIWLKHPFARLEFFVMYAVNICWSAIMLAQAYLDMTIETNECIGVQLSQKLIIFFHLKTHLEVFLTFLTPTLFAVRTLYLPTNTYPLYILLTSLTPQFGCSADISDVIFGLSFINVLIFGLGIPINFAMICSHKAIAPNLFRFLLMIGLIVQGGIIALLYLSKVNTSNDCLPTALVANTYCYICPIALFFSLTLMLQSPVLDHAEIRQKLLDLRLHKIPQKATQYSSPQKAEDKSVINETRSLYGTVLRR